ncbi:MAG: class I SAM-dependent rRNA methyltransferase, partial [bacterium]
MSKRTVAVRVSKEALKNIRKGHPWVFENSVVSMNRKAYPGDIGVVFDKKNRFAAVGLLDPFSMIRLRVLQFEKPAKIDKNWFRKKIDRALMKREKIINENTDGYRLIYGENDGFPGLIADFYSKSVVVKIYSLSWMPYLDL